MVSFSSHVLQAKVAVADFLKACHSIFSGLRMYSPGVWLGFGRYWKQTNVLVWLFSSMFYDTRLWSFEKYRTDYRLSLILGYRSFLLLAVGCKSH